MKNNNLNIHSLNGQYFSATIAFDKVVGRISVNENGYAYLCQNEISGGDRCNDLLGYKYAWFVYDILGDIKKFEVYNLRILIPTDIYHAVVSRLVGAFSFDRGDSGSDLAEQNSALSEAAKLLEGISLDEFFNQKA